MAAYQCLNCHQLERSSEDCCESPDLFCINDMPAEILKLRDILRRAGDAIEVLDGTSIENEKLVDDYRALNLLAQPQSNKE
jgi:hypothetical protein